MQLTPPRPTLATNVLYSSLSFFKDSISSYVIYKKSLLKTLKKFTRKPLFRSLLNKKETYWKPLLKVFCRLNVPLRWSNKVSFNSIKNQNCFYKLLALLHLNKVVMRCWFTVGLQPPKKLGFFASMKTVKNNEKCFLFQLKSSFCS